MIEVGLVAWDYPPSPSGLSTAAREIAESLAEAGAGVRVFTLDRTGTERRGGVEIVGCRPREGGRTAWLRKRAAIGHLAAPLAVRRAVLAAHAERPFDIVEATNWYAPAALLHVLSPVPVVTRNSTPATLTLGRGLSFRDRLDGWFARQIERRSAAASAGLISNTADHARRIRADYRLSDDGRPHAVIGLSLPPEVLQRGRAAGWPGRALPVRLLFVGRAEHRKGFDILMQAMAILSAQAASGTLAPFRLTLVGVSEADIPSGLGPVVRDRLTVPGRIDDAALSVLYASSHAVLAPSRYESFGLVYQEAMAYGRPVVALMEDASARVFVGDAGAGLLAEAPTAPALAAAIRTVVSDADCRERLRRGALASAGRFDRRSLGAETLALYRQVLGRA